MYYRESPPFDYMNLLCPLELAAQLLDEYGGREILDELLKTADWPERIGPLREQPRVLFLPQPSNFIVILVVKEEHRGTCHWFTNSLDGRTVIEFLMNQNEEELWAKWTKSAEKSIA